MWARYLVTALEDLVAHFCRVCSGLLQRGQDMGVHWLLSCSCALNQNLRGKGCFASWVTPGKSLEWPNAIPPTSNAVGWPGSMALPPKRWLESQYEKQPHSRDMRPLPQAFLNSPVAQNTEWIKIHPKMPTISLAITHCNYIAKVPKNTPMQYKPDSVTLGKGSDLYIYMCNNNTRTILNLMYNTTHFLCPLSTREQLRAQSRLGHSTAPSPALSSSAGSVKSALFPGMVWHLSHVRGHGMHTWRRYATNFKTLPRPCSAWENWSVSRGKNMQEFYRKFLFCDIDIFSHRFRMLTDRRGTCICLQTEGFFCLFFFCQWDVLEIILRILICCL